jgi:hypothetical protein
VDADFTTAGNCRGDEQGEPFHRKSRLQLIIIIHGDPYADTGDV